MLRATRILLSNLLVFAPRRPVTITLEVVPPDRRPEPKREAVNHWLEAWYNAEGRETPTFVPYHFLFGPRSVTYPPPFDETPEFELSSIKPETKQAVAQMLEEKLKRPLTEGENRAETSYMDLGLDSLERMEVSLAVEQRFGYSSDQVPAASARSGRWPRGSWRRPRRSRRRRAGSAPPSDLGPLVILGETVPAAFVGPRT